MLFENDLKVVFWKSIDRRSRVRGSRVRGPEAGGLQRQPAARFVPVSSEDHRFRTREPRVLPAESCLDRRSC